MIPKELEPVYQKPFQEAIQQLEDLVFQHDKAVLLGAGCSHCAGLPLTTHLANTALMSTKLSATSKAILTEIQSAFTGAQPAAHLEDYLSELVDWLAIVSRRDKRKISTPSITIGSHQYGPKELQDAVDEIKTSIAEQIQIPVDIEVHQRFVTAMHKPMRPGKAGYSQPIEYLVMNYDTLIEDSLALANIPYSDGFAGGVSGWWDPTTFDQKNLQARVYKLHGSINWQELPNSTIPHRIAPHIKPRTQSNKILIWPASTKYKETQLDPYAQLMSRARDLLNPMQGSQRVLLVSGYSFGDSHINLEIERGLRTSRGNLTVLAFISEDQPSGELLKWQQDVSITEQVLIFANKGFYHGEKALTSTNDLLWWKFEHLTSILEGGI